MSLFARLPGYIATGGTAAVVDISGFWALTSLGLPTAGAARLSFLVAAVVNYLLAARLVFDHATSSRHFGRFLSAALVGLCITRRRHHAARPSENRTDTCQDRRRGGRIPVQLSACRVLRLPPARYTVTLLKQLLDCPSVPEQRR
jgi:hypothetical protein